LRADPGDPVAPRARAPAWAHAWRAGSRAHAGRGAGGAHAPPLRGDDRAPVRHPRPGPPRGPLAAGSVPLDMEGEALVAPLERAAEPAAGIGRGRGDPHLRPQPARAAARRT